MKRYWLSEELLPFGNVISRMTSLLFLMLILDLPDSVVPGAAQAKMGAKDSLGLSALDYANQTGNEIIEAILNRNVIL